jgi:hypothetical protein
MANRVPLCITVDHDVIKAWAERMGARPARPTGDERPWPLMFDVGEPDPDTVEIGWDEFFREFERADLAFVCRNPGAQGERDDMHEFVKRASVPELTLGRSSTVIERVA